MAIFADAVIFSAGYAAKLLITGVFVELAIRPIAKHIARKVRASEHSTLFHYLLKHEGKSYACTPCSERSRN